MIANDNSTRVLAQFTRTLGIPVTRKSLSEQLEKHPDYYSMLALSEVLDNFNIPNAAYQVPHDQLAEVPVPFIATLADKSFIVVTGMDDKQVSLADGGWSRKKLPLADFLRKYGRSVLVAEPITTAPGEQGYRAKHHAEILQNLQLPLALACLAAVVLGVLALNPGYLARFTLQTGLLALFKTAGLATSVLLLVQSLDANNPLIQKLCGGAGDKNCNAILSSKQAKIWGISWSEVGFCYFAGTWLALLCSPANAAMLQLLALFNLLALPYTFYSVYYQWRVAKQWCVFCCVVQGLLWLEFFAFLPALLAGIHPVALNTPAALALSMLLPAALWLALKPYLLQLVQVPQLKQQLHKFKYNAGMFHAALKEQPKYTTPDDSWSMVLGNVEAENIITMVASPYCQPCAKAHLLIDDALNDDGNIQVRVVFVGDNTGEKDDKGRVHRHMMALNQLPDKTIIKKALHHWYGQKQKDYDTWAKAWPVNADEALIIAKLKQQKAWCDMAEIKATPTLLLNGYKLPPAYQVNDLKYMLG